LYVFITHCGVEIFKCKGWAGIKVRLSLACGFRLPLTLYTTKIVHLVIT
jgi:hypothetical protein